MKIASSTHEDAVEDVRTLSNFTRGQSKAFCLGRGGTRVGRLDRGVARIWPVDVLPRQRAGSGAPLPGQTWKPMQNADLRLPVAEDLGALRVPQARGLGL